VIRRVLLAASLFAAPVLEAQAPAPAPALAPAPPALKRIECTADFSFVNTGGNTEVTTTGVSDKLIWRPGAAWTFTQGFGIIYGRSQGEVTAENYKAGLRTDFAFSPKAGSYALVSFVRNVFAGNAATYEYSAGLTATPWDTEKHKLRFEGGIARINQRFTSGVIQRFFSARVATTYRHNFGKTTYFEQGLEVLPNLRDTDDLRINTSSALVAPISSHIGLKTGYSVRWDNLPPPTFKKFDTTLTTGLQVTF
jgi:putative salt-induced outer membrane protein YdiY